MRWTAGSRSQSYGVSECDDALADVLRYGATSDGSMEEAVALVV
jgi:hypothetical protein